MEDLSLEVEESDPEVEYHKPEEETHEEDLDEGPPAELEEEDVARKQMGFTEALEQSGSLDMLAEALVNLYTSPKPTAELFAFFLQTIGSPEAPDVDKLLQENQDLRKNIVKLKEQIVTLEAKVRK
jgi:hypothetical protein